MTQNENLVWLCVEKKDLSTLGRVEYTDEVLAKDKGSNKKTLTLNDFF